MKSPTGRLTQDPEWQHLGRRFHSIAEHTRQIQHLDFSGAELRVLAYHDTDEYRSWFEQPETKPR